MDESSFTDSVRGALAAAVESSLGLAPGTVRVVGVEPVYADEPTVVSSRRLLGQHYRSLQAARVIIGYRIVLAIVQTALATSSVASAGTSLETSVSTAVTRISTDGTLASNLVAASPAVLTDLGYASASQFTSSVRLDPTRRVTTVVAGVATPAAAKGISSGGVAAIAVVLCVLAVAGGVGYVYYTRRQAATAVKAGAAAAVSKTASDAAAGEAWQGENFAGLNPMAKAKFEPTKA